MAMDHAYLQNAVGRLLVDVLARVAQLRPEDPVAYISRYLLAKSTEAAEAQAQSEAFAAKVAAEAEAEAEAARVRAAEEAAALAEQQNAFLALANKVVCARPSGRAVRQRGDQARGRGRRTDRKREREQERGVTRSEGSVKRGRSGRSGRSHM